MRLTLVSSSLGGGGAERNIVWLAGALAGKGHVVTLVTVHSDVADSYPVPPRVQRVWAPREAARSCRWFGWSCVRRRSRALGSTVQATRPEAVISFIDTMNISVLMPLASTGIPIIVAERVDPRHHHIGLRWNILRRFYYPKSAAVVVQTQAVAAWATAIWPRWRIATIHNPVPKPAPSRSRRPGWFAARNLVGMGRLVDQKGFDLLIDAFAPLAKTFPDWDLTILGEGCRRAELTERARQRSIADRVHLVGAVTNPQSVLAHADLFVLSSRFEGFPNALCEAMACGVPAISFDCPSGPAEIIRDGVNGILVRNGNVEALRAALRTLMTDEYERRRLGHEARRITESYAEDRILDLWEDLLNSIVKPMTVPRTDRCQETGDSMPT